MEASRVAALRGHKVTLMEKNPRLGGALHIAAIPPHKEEIKYIIEYYSHVLPQLRNLDIQLDMEAKPGNIEALKPDVVILATGAEPFIPADIEQKRPSGILSAHQVLSGDNVGKRAIVVGGGLIGCETALFLAQQKKQVIILEILENVGVDMEPLVRKCLMKELDSFGVEIHTNTKVKEITEEGVMAIENGQEKEFEGDSVVLALGLKPVNGLKDALKGKVGKIAVIGDAKGQGKIRAAISEGFVTSFYL